MGLPVPPLPWWGWLIAVVAVRPACSSSEPFPIRLRGGEAAVRIGGAVALALGFVAACVWAWLLVGLAIMVECG